MTTTTVTTSATVPEAALGGGTFSVGATGARLMDEPSCLVALRRRSA